MSGKNNLLDIKCVLYCRVCTWKINKNKFYYLLGNCQRYAKLRDKFVKVLDTTNFDLVKYLDSILRTFKFLFIAFLTIHIFFYANNSKYIFSPHIKFLQQVKPKLVSRARGQWCHLALVHSNTNVKYHWSQPRNCKQILWQKHR